MTLPAEQLETTSKILGLTSSSELLKLASSVARKCAKKNNRTGLAIIDELEAEAWYVTLLIAINGQEKLVKHPTPISLFLMQLGFELKKYLMSFKQSSVYSSERQGRFVPKIVQTAEFNNKYRNVDDIAIFIALESVIKTDIEWSVYEQLILEKDDRVAAYSLGISFKKFRKIKNKIKGRLML